MTKLLRSYVFWSHERGSLHYDVMVTGILLFIFITPHFIDYKDKPAPPVPLHGSEVLVKASRAEGDSVRIVYEVRAEDLGSAATQTDDARRAALLRVIEPISGDVKLESYQPVLDTKGKTVAYDATILR